MYSYLHHHTTYKGEAFPGSTTQTIKLLCLAQQLLLGGKGIPDQKNRPLPNG